MMVIRIFFKPIPVGGEEMQDGYIEFRGEMSRLKARIFLSLYRALALKGGCVYIYSEEKEDV